MSDEINNDELGLLREQREKSKKQAKKTSGLASTLEFVSKAHLKAFCRRMKARFSKKFNFVDNDKSLTCEVTSIKGATPEDKERYLKWHETYEKQFPEVAEEK